MKIGDLVKSKWIRVWEIFVITEIDKDGKGEPNDDYVVVNSQFLMRKDELEVLSESK